MLDETLLDYLRPAGVTELLLGKASQDVRVRVMVAEPGHHLTPLLGHPGIELRTVDSEHQTISRYDNDMLITLPLIGEADEPPPLIHIQRRGDGGLFDRFAAHYQDSWDKATEPLRNEADIERYLYEDEGSNIDEITAGTPTPAIVEPPPPAPRRWPRRPA